MIFIVTSIIRLFFLLLQGPIRNFSSQAQIFQRHFSLEVVFILLSKVQANNLNALILRTVPDSRFAFPSEYTIKVALIFPLSPQSYSATLSVQWGSLGSWSWVFAHLSKVQTCFHQSQKPWEKWISIWIYLNLHPWDIWLVPESVDLKVDYFIAAQMFDVPFVIYVLHLCECLVIEEQRIAALDSLNFPRLGSLHRWV